MDKKRLPVTKLINECDLEIKYGEDKITSTYIKSSNVYRPSLSAPFYSIFPHSKNAPPKKSVFLTAAGSPYCP